MATEADIKFGDVVNRLTELTQEEAEILYEKILASENELIRLRAENDLLRQRVQSLTRRRIVDND